MALALQEAQKINDQRGGKRRLAQHARESIVNRLSQSSTGTRSGGLALLAATALFVFVFGYLAVRFDYPAVLDRPAAEVLPALRGLGVTGQAVWLLYALVPLLLIPTARSVQRASQAVAPQLGQAAVWLAFLSAAAMMTGLLRWSTLQWWLAGRWPSASPAARGLIAHRFDAANLYLGNVAGEFLGELFLNGFFLVAALALARVWRQRWLATAGVVVSVVGWVAMLRNITDVVAPVAEVNNSVLPAWMLVLGLVMVWPGPWHRHADHAETT